MAGKFLVHNRRQRRLSQIGNGGNTIISAPSHGWTNDPAANATRPDVYCGRGTRFVRELGDLYVRLEPTTDFALDAVFGRCAAARDWRSLASVGLVGIAARISSSWPRVLDTATLIGAGDGCGHCRALLVGSGSLRLDSGSNWLCGRAAFIAAPFAVREPRSFAVLDIGRKRH